MASIPEQSGTTLAGRVSNVDARASALELHASDWVRVKDSPYKAKGDGATNDTAAIQQAMTASVGRRLIVSAGAYRVGALTVPSQTTLWLEPGAILSAVATLGANERLLNITDVSDVTIYGYGALITMGGLYTSGEQRHNVCIRGGQRVRVFGLRSDLSGGDGFYVGAGDVNAWSEDVLLQDCVASENRRQGLSVVSAKKLIVRGGRYADTGKGAAGGTDPKAGIDIEPNGSSDRLESVRLENVATENNAGSGILVYPAAFGGTGNTIDIDISGHASVGDLNGFQVGTLAVGATPPVGQITSRYPTIAGSQNQGVIIRNYDALGPRVILDHPTIANANESGQTSANYGAGITVYRENTETGATQLGAVEIVAPDVYDSRTTAKMTSAIYTADGVSPRTMANIAIRNPRRLGWSDPAKAGSSPLVVQFAGTITDPDGVLARTFQASMTPTDFNHSRIWSNQGATAPYTVTLTGNYPVNGPDISFEQTSTWAIVLNPGASGTISPFGGTGATLTSRVLGSKITLRKVSATGWRIIEQTGTWYWGNAIVEPANQTITGTTTETVFTTHSRTVKANTVQIPGFVAEWFLQGTVAGTAGTKTIRVKWGSTTIATLIETAAQVDGWAVQARMMARGTNAQDGWIVVYQGNAVVAVAGVSPNETDTADIALIVTAQLASAADSATVSQSDFRHLFMGK